MNFLFCLNYFIIAEAYSQVSIASTPCSRKMYSPKISQSVSFKERSHSMWLLSQSSLVAFFFPSKSPPSLTPYSPLWPHSLCQPSAPFTSYAGLLLVCRHATYDISHSGPWTSCFLGWKQPSAEYFPDCPLYPFRSLLKCQLSRQAISNSLY